MPKGLRVALALVAGLALLAGTGSYALPVEAAIPVFINEIHYDNTGGDTGEAIEIAGPAGTNLAGWSLVRYNGSNSLVYTSPAGPTVTGTIPNQQNGFGTLAFTYPTDGLQNGSPDGIALVNASNVVVQFLCYEGTITAADGPAVGMTCSNLPVTEPGTDAVGQSLRLSGTGTVYGDFTWQAPATASFGSVNTGQTFSSSEQAPAVSGTTPAHNATGVLATADITVNFTEPVNVTGTWFTINCANTGAHTAAVSGGPSSFTLNPNVDFGSGELCTLTVLAAQVTDQDANDPPDNPAADFTASFTTAVVISCSSVVTPIGSIQGTGAAAAITGPVVTKGVVVGKYDVANSLSGFYIQDPVGDGNPNTSDGIFVFTSTTNGSGPALGTLVVIAGTAGEFQDQTQISSVTSIVECGSGNSITPTPIAFPFTDPFTETHATSLEAYEGMVVTVPQTLYVTEHFQLGRFGQVLLSGTNRLRVPTTFVDAGAAALAEIAKNNLNKILVDDELQSQNPDPIKFGRGGNPLSAANTLRGGDTIAGLTGVMTYGWAGNSASPNAYRIRPINALGVTGAPNFAATNARPTAAPTVGGSLKVVGMNLLNLFNTFDGLPDTVDNCRGGVSGTAPVHDCRGADTQVELDRQWPKTVAGIKALNPDIVGVNEIENDGYGPTSTLKFLIDKLNIGAAPADLYAYIDVDANTGQVDAMGTDAIKVGLLYKPAKVTPIGTTGALNSVAFVNGGDSGPRSRASLAQAFMQNSNGQEFIVNVNHLKSKGSACDADPPTSPPDTGNCNQVRTNAANALVAWLASNPTGTGDPDILLIGDYNSYNKETPIRALEAGGYINVIANKLGPDAYSYVFDGQWGYLDYALATSTMLAQIAGVGDYHINADEPTVLDFNLDFKSVGQQTSLYAADQFRISDHDPVIVGLNLSGPLKDTDGDGVPDFTDNCDKAPNPGQQDSDNDGKGNACDADGLIPAACNGLLFDAVFQGGAGNDTINGTIWNDLILTGPGNDKVDGKGGNDCIDTGSGNDSVTAGAGNDVILAGEGNNTVNAGEGNNKVTSGNGNDKVTTGTGNDTVTDAGGNNTIDTGGGNDTVTTGVGGNNTINAGEGGDTITVGHGNNTINCGPGTDAVTKGNGMNTNVGGACETF